jgi:flagellar biogenesis protein FliO
MRFIALFLFALIGAHASNLLTHNIYERSDRIDVMLSFDAPYEGKIFQKKEPSQITLTLEDLYFNQFVEKEVASPILQSLIIEPSGDNTTVTIKSNQAISVIASKTVDGFGLRIRARLVAAPEPRTAAQAPAPIPSNDESIVDARYLSVIGVMLLLLLVLFWIKRKMGTKSLGSKEASWLFPSGSKHSEAMKVLYQKPLDGTNKVVLLEFGNQQFLIVTGASNLLLEKFGQGRVNDDNEFKEVFEQNRQKLDEYLRIQQSQLSSYKEKASQDYMPTR